MVRLQAKSDPGSSLVMSRPWVDAPPAYGSCGGGHRPVRSVPRGYGLRLWCEGLRLGGAASWLGQLGRWLGADGRFYYGGSHGLGGRQSDSEKARVLHYGETCGLGERQYDSGKSQGSSLYGGPRLGGRSSD